MQWFRRVSYPLTKEQVIVMDAIDSVSIKEYTTIAVIKVISPMTSNLLLQSRTIRFVYIPCQPTTHGKSYRL